MKKIPQTITGRVFGIVFLTLLTVGASLANPISVEAELDYNTLFDTGSSVDFVSSTAGTANSPGETVNVRITLDTGLSKESGNYTQDEIAAIDEIYSYTSGESTTWSPKTWVILIKKTDGSEEVITDITSRIQGTTSTTTTTDIFGAPVTNIHGPAKVANLSFTINSTNPIIASNSNYTLGFYYRSNSDGEGGGDADLDGSGSNAYYRIGSEKTFATSNGTPGASSGNTNNLPPETSTSSVEKNDGGFPECSLGFLPGTTMNISGCFAQLVYYAIFVPTSFILALSGQFMDFLLGYTLDSGSYSIGNFVGQGWKLVRDLTNILFIFILVSIGIGTIIGNSKLGDKKLIGWVIIVALLINFSLFFTKVIIDAGNILGTVFYSAMGVKASSTTSAITNNSLFAGDEKSISVAIVSKFNPQTLFQEINQYNMKVPGIAGEPEVVNTGTPPGWFTIVTLILSVINVVTAYTFFVVGLLFMGRVVGLWIAMMLSPLAFMSLAVPSYMSFLFSEYKFSSWAEKVAKLSFSAPIFLFFLYIVLSFLKGGFLTEAMAVTSDMTTMEKFLSTLVPFVIITMLILKAKDVTVKMSDEIGKKFASWGESLGSLAVGGALAIGTGGAALAMRGTVGRAASAISQSQTMQTAKGKSGIVGMASRLALRGTDKLSKASFDARNTSAADALKSSPLKIDLKRNTIGNAFLGTNDKDRGLLGSSSGGIEGMNKRREADIVKEAEERQLKGFAFDQQDKRAKEYKTNLATATESQKAINMAAEGTVSPAVYNADKNRKIQADIARGVIEKAEDFNEGAYKETYFASSGYKDLAKVENEIKENFERTYGKNASLTGAEFNKKAVGDFKDEVAKGNYGVGGAIKSTIENITGKDLNQATLPNYGKAGIFGATAALGGVAAAAPLAGAGMISSAVGGFNEPQRAGALKAIDKKFGNKDLESVTNELKKIDADIKDYLTNEGKLTEDQIKNLTNFEKQAKLSEIRKEKEKDSREIKFERDEKNELYKREIDPVKKKLLREEILTLDARQSEVRDKIDELKNLFDKRDRKQDAKEKLENKINPKDKKDDKGGEKKDDKK
ncbi:MAG: hypothetical protein KBC49_03710 [Candidatus Pacebacteria bacterium]|nr:hypothetical protein [Candidatus Paceibacterota bacterium]